MVRRRDGKIYTGISKDVEARFEQHCISPKRGARFLRGMGPLKLLNQAEVGDQASAMHIERTVKKLQKDKKEEIASDPKKLENLVSEEKTAYELGKKDAESEK